MKRVLTICAAICCAVSAAPSFAKASSFAEATADKSAGKAAGRPNIVMFVVDDMCDWIGPMGHTQAVTPHMDRLAAQGVTFLNAHTAGTFCAPSRSALFTGRHSSSTGCYTTQVYFHQNPGITPLQKVLQDGGYATHGAGKLFHHPAGFVDLRGWNEFFLRDAEQKARGWPLESWTTEMPFLPDPYPNSIFNRDRKPANKFFLEWGKVKNGNEEKMADTIRTEWACGLLRKKHDKPVFVAVGLYAPHFPNYAPAKYFDLYDAKKIKLPPYKVGDLDDLPPKLRKAKEARGAHHRRLVGLDAVDDAIHGYLACISYADAMLGRVLDAIESGPHADNTIVVLWSDHGYHHGEKLDWGKHTLWERTSNVPFIWAGPGIAKGAAVDATVSLIDVFPTLTELCGVRDGQARDGVSLAPVLKNPAAAKDRDVLLPGMKPEEYAIMNRDWRYIRYADGTEELYNTGRDPNEWDNLAGNPEYGEVKEKLRAAAPSSFAEPGPAAGRLKLVIEGDGFKWQPRNAPRKRVNVVPGVGVGMTPLRESPEARTSPIEIQGRSAWKSGLRPGKPTFFFFKLNDPAYRNGRQPSVQVAITYLDRGNAEVVVQYDSSDPRVNKSHPKGAGVFKEATRFKTGNSGKWKTTVFNLGDAQFAGRCNGCDLRVVYPRPDEEPVVAEVSVKAISSQKRSEAGRKAARERGAARKPDPAGKPADHHAADTFDAVAIGDGVDLPKLANDAIREASGLAQSRSGGDLFWINNDSGDSNRIYATNRNGDNLGQLRLTGAKSVDYEDIATGPGPDRSRNYIYVADVGDNASHRSDVRIYRVPEPDLSGLSTPFNIKSAAVDVFPFSYPDGPHNCETLMIDPETLDFYLVIKRGGDAPILYRGTTGRPGAPQTVAKMGEMPHLAKPGAVYDPPRPLYKPAGITAGDVSRDGREIIIRTHRRAFYWRRRSGESIARAMILRPPVIFKGQWREPAGESICFAADGSGYFTLSEEAGGHQARLRFYRRKKRSGGRSTGFSPF